MKSFANFHTIYEIEKKIKTLKEAWNAVCSALREDIESEKCGRQKQYTVFRIL